MLRMLQTDKICLEKPLITMNRVFALIGECSQPKVYTAKVLFSLPHTNTPFNTTTTRNLASLANVSLNVSKPISRSLHCHFQAKNEGVKCHPKPGSSEFVVFRENVDYCGEFSFKQFHALEMSLQFNFRTISL